MIFQVAGSCCRRRLRGFRFDFFLGLGIERSRAQKAPPGHRANLELAQLAQAERHRALVFFSLSIFDPMEASWPIFHAVNHSNFLSRVDVLRLALTSPRVAGTVNWIALWRNEDSLTRRRPRRAQLPLARPRRPISFAPRALDALRRIAALNENNAAAFRRLATGRPRGTVVTWGATTSGQRDDAPTDANFVAVACGTFDSVGLRADGTVVTWGNTTLGQRNNAPTDANFVAVAGGAFYSVGLRADGTVVSWGATGNGQRDDAPTDTNFVAIACGDYHSVGLTPCSPFQ